MKIKKIIINILGLLCLSIIKINENNLKYLFKEINIVYFTSIISSNLYDEEINVSDTYINVIDYYNINDSLYVEPINNEIILPISGVISKIDKNMIYLSTTNGIIIIDEVNSTNYHLYTYYKAYNVLGYSDKYIISLNLDLVKNKYKINYEKV